MLGSEVGAFISAALPDGGGVDSGAPGGGTAEDDPLRAGAVGSDFGCGLRAGGGGEAAGGEMRLPFVEGGACAGVGADGDAGGAG